MPGYLRWLVQDGAYALATEQLELLRAAEQGRWPSVLEQGALEERDGLLATPAEPGEVTPLEQQILRLCAGAGRPRAQIDAGCKPYGSKAGVEVALQKLIDGGRLRLKGRAYVAQG